MRQIFADSAFWIALISPRDTLHPAAVREISRAKTRQITTSEMVLVEVLNFFSGADPAIRQGASQFVARLITDGLCEVVPQTSEQFREALRLYQERQDKSWSLTDCASMLLMRARGIQQVLTEDHHFQQAGFETLLSRQT